MSQHDYVLADAAGAAFRSDANSALGAIVSRNSGATAPATTYAHMLWVDTTAGLLKRRNAANSAWVIESTIDETFVLSRSTNTILDESDRGKVLIATAGFTQTLTAAATLTDGWFVDIIVDSGATLVIDPNASETVDGATTKSIVGPSQGRLVCNGTLFRTVGFASATAATQSEQETGSSTTVFVTPGRQQYHPSAAKAWCYADTAGAVNASYNISSATDVGTGRIGFNFTTAFSSANYAVVVGTRTAFTAVVFASVDNSGTQTASRSDAYASTSTTGAATDPANWYMAAYGDQ